MRATRRPGSPSRDSRVAATFCRSQVIRAHPIPAEFAQHSWRIKFCETTSGQCAILIMLPGVRIGAHPGAKHGRMLHDTIATRSGFGEANGAQGFEMTAVEQRTDSLQRRYGALRSKLQPPGQAMLDRLFREFQHYGEASWFNRHLDYLEDQASPKAEELRRLKRKALGAASSRRARSRRRREQSGLRKQSGLIEARVDPPTAGNSALGFRARRAITATPT